MLRELKREANLTSTLNGAVTNYSTFSDCLDLFAAVGALRSDRTGRAADMFIKAYCESPDYAMKILFYARDIRQGLGERAVFRNILRSLAFIHPESVIKNIEYISEYGRYDDFLVLFGTPCENEALAFIKQQLDSDTVLMKENRSVSLLAKWLPSVNCSDKSKTELAKKICRYLGISQKEYRKTLSALRSHIDITETHLCCRKYDFPYEHVPSKAMFQYRRAFYRNDSERYKKYLEDVKSGNKKMHADTLYPYDIVEACLELPADPEQRKILDVTWNSLADRLSDDVRHKNAIAVVDGSGSMYSRCSFPRPITVALSLGIYFAERSQGCFHNHFITFSSSPRLVEIKGSDICSKVQYCMEFNEIANTDIEKTFMLILKTAVSNDLPQSEMPELLYIISDMEFDCCSRYDKTIYEAMKEEYKKYGYALPQIVFWNVHSFNQQYPVTENDKGTVLVSGASPNIFKLCMSNEITPYSLMMKVLNSERYAVISA